MRFSTKQLRYLRQSRVARLGTVDARGKVHIVPIVFANSKSSIFFVVDKKRKTTANLKRLRNLKANRYATLLVDRFSEDWKKLSFLIIYCEAKILRSFKHLREKSRAAKLLQLKYSQYRSSQYFPPDLDTAIFVRLRPIKATYWQNLRNSLT